MPISGSYSYEGLKRLQQTLNATGALSQDYASEIFGWALEAARNGYEEGHKIAERDDTAEVDNRRLRVVVSELEQRCRVLAGAAVEDEQEIEELQTRLTIAEATRDRARNTIIRLRRERCDEAGCECGVQRCSQPRVDCCA